MRSISVPLARIPKSGVSIEENVPLAQLQPGEVEPLPIDAIALTGKVLPAGDEYIFKGRCAGAFEHPCDRCLAMARIPFVVDMTWAFQEGPKAALLDSELQRKNDTRGGAYTYQGGEIDLAPYLWEELVLATPEKFMCKEDCAGLCPQCGANRNTEGCACSVETSDTPGTHKGLAGLADLFPSLAPKKQEE